jgi:predicted ATPase
MERVVAQIEDGGIRAGESARYVIAGGPGSGKSALLEALSRAGEVCYPEISRELIREQRAIGGGLLPWADLAGFAAECAARMGEAIRGSSVHSRCFFDRGLPDLIGYLSHGGRMVPPGWREASRAYAREVFFAPPWRDIFVQDAERPQTFEEAEALGTHVRRAYLDCGFTIVELVRGSVPERVAQVRAHLAPLREASVASPVGGRAHQPPSS